MSDSLAIPDKHLPKPKPEGYVFGRPTDYIPDICNQALAYARANPGASIAELAVHLSVSKVTVYAWAQAHPDFMNALNQYRAHGEADAWSRLKSRTVDPNAMFILKAAHGFTDRPDQVQSQQQASAKVEIRIRVLDGAKKRDALDVEYSVVEDKADQ